MKEATGATLCLHHDDLDLWKMLEAQCHVFGVAYVPVPLPDYWLKDEEKLHVGQISAVALHTPGHTPFRGGIGRTDLWGGDFDAIEQSIRERLYTLKDATIVVTGHGSDTEIGLEKKTNRFVRA